MVHVLIMLTATLVLVLMATLEQIVKQVCHTKTGLIIICILIIYIAIHRYPNINCMFYLSTASN